MPGQNSLCQKTGAFNDFFKIDSQIKCFAFLLILPITAYGSAQVTTDTLASNILSVFWYSVFDIWKLYLIFIFMSFIISRFEYVFKGFFLPFIFLPSCTDHSSHLFSLFSYYIIASIVWGSFIIEHALLCYY